MMRTSSGIVCAFAGALSFAVACSWGGASSSSDPTPDASIGTTGAHCGDGTCAASEVTSCPQDCGSGMHGSGSGSNVQAVCGNGTCDTGETATSCPSDCVSQGSGSGSASAACSDPNTILACILCENGLGCTGVDVPTCMACGI